VTSAAVYGRLLAAPTIERGVEVCLRYWLGPYLGEVLEQAGHARDLLPDPADLVRVADLSEPTSSQIAVVIVASPGTTGDTRREADAYTATWDVRAGVLMDLGSRLESREAAQFGAAAAGAALSHQGVADVMPDLTTWRRNDAGDLVVLAGSSVRWVGETYRVLDRRGMSPTLIAGEAIITVTVEGARSAFGGPEEPPRDPDSDLPSRDPAVSGDPSPVDPSLTITADPPWRTDL
jgi:hypothetical protein